MTAHVQGRGRRAKRWALLVVGVLLIAAVAGRGYLKEGRAWYYGLQAYLYGFPLIMMDLTKEAATAVPTAGEITAPINQFAVMTKYPDASFRAVVRTGLDSYSRRPGRISIRSRSCFRFRVPMAATTSSLCSTCGATSSRQSESARPEQKRRTS